MKRKPLVLSTAVALALALSSSFPASAQSLGTASSFAVFGGSTVTNTGATTVTGDLGVFPGSAITGFPPGIVTGTTHLGDATAGTAQNDVTTAYNFLAAQPCPGGNNMTGIDLGGKTLVPGVYCFSSSAQLTGTLTLSGSGTWIFQIGTTLTTASNSNVVVIGGGSNCNVWWQVGSSATLGTTTAFVGNILALQSITLTTSATVNGRALARNGAVTLDTNTVGSSACTVGLPTPQPATATALAAATAAAATATSAAAPAPSGGGSSTRPRSTATTTPTTRSEEH